jgi:hypothetical protein
MITIGDLDKIITQWKLKLAEPVSDEYDAIYNDAINDCLYDINNLIEERIAEEERAYAYMNEV